MKEIGAAFSKFDQSNYYSRIDAVHPLEIWYGLDENGRKAVELRAKFHYKNVKGTTAIEINQYHNDQYNTICFSLKNPEMEGLFFKFCEDLVERTRTIQDGNEGYLAIINRYYQWKKMFLNPTMYVLGEREIMGLIGEILFLTQKLIPEVGTTRALNSWSGQELTHKDFSLDDTWYEIKAISKARNEVSISSLEQLDSDKDGSLIVYLFEKMSPEFSGITLNKLVFESLKCFDTDSERDDFINKVNRQGYSYNTCYDTYIYDVKDRFEYIVSDSFPRLTKANVPDAVIKAKYELSLTAIDGFRRK